MEWALILYIYANALAKGDAVSLVTVPMETKQLCETAGSAASSLVLYSAKSVRYICVKVKQ